MVLERKYETRVIPKMIGENFIANLEKVTRRLKNEPLIIDDQKKVLLDFFNTLSSKTTLEGLLPSIQFNLTKVWKEILLKSKSDDSRNAPILKTLELYNQKVTSFFEGLDPKNVVWKKFVAISEIYPGYIAINKKLPDTGQRKLLVFWSKSASGENTMGLPQIGSLALTFFLDMISVL
ncbi:hypothetical protein CROQUDRAFT_707177 [Cronartium quercuum f. sp. fusiforme G11]|uniref:Uncharacterized protein n=1 Tax=Cronartium quercuum f. sp. fusiforme G11 TaxID=708437 RepID=A0A9P6NJB3_9BASI|nr:hypothetical protein CROQUDRAFT_707177 [Cronartium quercuum f. sp. fusiforme G11]